MACYNDRGTTATEANMKLLVLADIHGHVEHLSAIGTAAGTCNGIVIAGDITDFGGAEQAQFIISSLSAFGKPLLAVPGNCDLPKAADELKNSGISLQGHHIEIGGLQFVGAGGSLPSTAVEADETGEETFRRTLARSVSGLASTDNLVLVTHQPAWGVGLDRRDSGRHGGSRAVREFIEQYQPILAISGHIHEAYGIDQLGATMLLNPGSFRRGHYAVAEINGRDVHVQLYP
jgi:Icc-related predicted phosphoesterase